MEQGKEVTVWSRVERRSVEWFKEVAVWSRVKR